MKNMTSGAASKLFVIFFALPFWLVIPWLVLQRTAQRNPLPPYRPGETDPATRAGMTL